MAEANVVHHRYQIGELLGEGGMGVVFRALDLHTQRPVAIKALKPASVTTSPIDIQRFLREGAALKALEHPNIVKLLDMFQEGERHYLVMDLVEGGSLERTLAAKVPLPLERVLSLALDLSDALSRVHAIGIVHRDLKPANVLLAIDGTPRLCDFGVAHIAGEARLSASNGVVGTLDYLSPETLSGETIDARSDIWAFGVLLFELLAGRPPFTGHHPAATLHAILNAAPPELEALRPDCPTELVDLTCRMLEKHRQQRIPSARQVGAELERIRTRSGEGSPQRAAKPERDAAVLAKTLTAPTASTPAAPQLPAQTTPFVGRETELSELARLLLDPAVRLVTVLGPGGMGKSRLALEAALRFAQGSCAFAVTERGPPASPSEVFLVELASLPRAELVLAAIAEAVGFEFYPGAEPKTQLVGFLRAKHLLLVLDNFEHLIDAAGLLNEILLAAPGLKVLATSRERLGLSGENVFVLSGLPVPDSNAGERWAELSSVQLFADSARRVKRDFQLTGDAMPAVAQICRLVQGLPLGIVLAASWSNLLGVEEIAAEIAKSFDFLSNELKDMPARQHSLRAVFDYSYGLLGPEERAVFARLAVFRGGFTRAAAQQVTTANLRTLGALLDKSLISRDPLSGRYRVHELLRQYAESRLAAVPGETERFALAHAEHYASFVAERAARFKGSAPQLAAAELESELDNVRTAWHYLLRATQLDAVASMLEGLNLFYAFRSAFAEAETAFGQVVVSFGEPPPERGSARAQLLASALTLQAGASLNQWRNVEASSLSARALVLLDESREPAAFARALLVWAMSALWARNEPGALEASERALQLYRQLGERWETSQALALLARYGDQLGAVKVEACARESIELQRALSGGVVLQPECLTDLGSIWAQQGKYAEGCRLMLEGLSLLEAQGKPYGKLSCLQQLSGVQRQLGEYDAAEANARQSLALARERFPFAEGWCHALLAGVLRERDQLDEAAFHFRAALGDDHPVTVALATVNLGDIERQRGDHVRASVLFAEALAAFERHGASWGVVVACDYLGHLACEEGRAADAKSLFERGIELALEGRLLPLAMNMLAGIARERVMGGEVERAVELLSLLEAHPITEHQTQVRVVRPLLVELSSRLQVDSFAAAAERGRALALADVLREWSPAAS